VIEDLRGQLENMRKGDLNHVIKRYESEIGKIKSAHKAELESFQCQVQELNEIIHKTEQELMLKESQMLDTIAISQGHGNETSIVSTQNSILIDCLKNELTDLRQQCKLYREDHILTEFLKRLTLNGNDIVSAANNLPFSEYVKLVEANRSKTNQLAELRNQLRESREEKYSLKLQSAEYEKMLAEVQSQFKTIREQEMHLYRELSDRDNSILQLEHQLKDYETDESLLAEIEKELRQLRSANQQLKILYEQERASAESLVMEKEKALLDMRMSFEHDLERYKLEHEENERQILEMTKKQLESIFESRLHSLQVQLDEKERHLMAREKDRVSLLEESERKLSDMRHEKEMELLRIKKDLLTEKEKQLEKLYSQSELERQQAIESIEAKFLAQIDDLTTTTEQQAFQIVQLNSQLQMMMTQKEDAAHTYEIAIQRLNHEWTTRLVTETKTLEEEHRVDLNEHEKQLQENFDVMIHKLKTEYEDTIQVLKLQYQQHYETQLADITRTHEITLKELDSHWNTHLQSELAGVQRQFTKQYTEEFQQMESQYTDELHELHKQQEDTLTRWKMSQQRVQSLETDLHTLRGRIFELESYQPPPIPMCIDQTTQSDPVPSRVSQDSVIAIQRIEEKLKDKCKKAYEKALNQMKEEFLEYERRLYDRVRQERHRRHPPPPLPEKETHHRISRRSNRPSTQNFSDRIAAAPSLGHTHYYY
jgi:hypothetical protein